MTDDQYRDSPEYRRWEEENSRRSAVMSSVEQHVQGKLLDEDELADDEDATAP